MPSNNSQVLGMWAAPSCSLGLDRKIIKSKKDRATSPYMHTNWSRETAGKHRSRLSSLALLIVKTPEQSYCKSCIFCEWVDWLNTVNTASLLSMLHLEVNSGGTAVIMCTRGLRRWFLLFQLLSNGSSDTWRRTARFQDASVTETWQPSAAPQFWGSIQHKTSDCILI